MIAVGTTVQYRKVGRAVVTEVLQSTSTSHQVRLRFITGPRAYRPGGRIADSLFWVTDTDEVKS